MENMKIGVPSDEEFDKPARRKTPTQYFDIVEGSNIYRPLPPFGELAESGIWAVKTATHWGYRSSDGRPKNFLCLGPGCPECALRAKIQEELDAAEEGSDVAELCSKFLYDHNLDIRHNVNVLNTSGKIGLLRLKTKMWQDFTRERQHLKKFKIHPAHATTGCWLDFNKTGKGAQGVFRVTAVKEEAFIDGQVVSKMKVQPLSEDIVKRMESEAFELNKLVRKLTLEEATLLVSSVTDLQYDADVVDAVFKVPAKATTSNEEVASEASPVETPKNTLKGRAVSDSAFENYLRAGKEE